MALEKIEVQVPSELLEFARRLIQGQESVSIDDVIVDSLYRYRMLLENEPHDRDRLIREIQKGLAELDRGEVVDEQTVFDELDQILARKTQPAASASSTPAAPGP